MNITPPTDIPSCEPELGTLVVAQACYGLLFCSAAIAAGGYLPGLPGAYITQFNIIVMAFVYMGIIKWPKRFTCRSAASIAVGSSVMWGFLSIQEQLVGARPIPDEHHMPQVVIALLTIYGLAEGAAYVARRYVWNGFKVLAL
ncbi:hypothetical protein EC849_10456 [Pseudomonas putida]|uniref:hypothetical protein n=1 Tax=Pseudomonas putida TaxID=303 RepID=UPI0010439AB5|nr:hypothetical protein [Pseudomonas putida]TCP76981.1 hypothetical protein EC849_10456 [Pseudomonas putida]